MIFEVLVPAVATVIVAFIVFGGKILDNRTSTRDNSYDRLITRQDQMDKELQELRTRTDKDRKRIADLEGTLHDKDELLTDVRDILLWVESGSKPPSPEMTWRIRQWLDKPTTGEIPIQKE